MLVRLYQGQGMKRLASSTALATLMVLSYPAPSEAPVYDRSDWKHWVDVDTEGHPAWKKDCQDARQETLIEASEVVPSFKTDRRCMVVLGQWTDPYTGTVIEEASKVDIDHVVALRDAWDSGGAAWSADRKAQFANDPDNLLAVSASANRSKGSRGPSEWLPPKADYRCEYIRKWVGVMSKYDLAITPCEHDQIDYLIKICDSGGIPVLPQ